MRKIFLLLSLVSFHVIYAQEQNDTSKVYTAVDQMPQFKGGIDSLNKYLLHYVNYTDSNRSGTVYVNFIVSKIGDVINPKIIMGMRKAPENDSIALSSIKRMPRWTPGKQNGQPVNVQCNLPVRFLMLEYTKVHAIDANRFNYNINKGDTIYSLAEKMPIPPNGSLYNYVNEHIQYHSDEMSEDVSGTVFVNFIIEKDGSVDYVHVVKAVPEDEGLEQEAVRVIFTMPKWAPGMHDGHPVKVEMTFPVAFSLTKNKYLRSIDTTYIDYFHHDTDSAYEAPDQMPEFTGYIGEYLYKNIEIPKQGTTEAYGGIVRVGFIIEKDGTVNYVKLLQRILLGGGPGFDMAALVVVASMPKWKPGLQNGKPVRVKTYLSLYFQKGRFLPPKENRH